MARIALDHVEKVYGGGVKALDDRAIVREPAAFLMDEPLSNLDGIRPSDFEDSAFVDQGWPRIVMTTGVTEGLGTEIHVIFTIDAPPVEHALITSAAGGDDEEDDTVTALAGGKSLWTARVSARSAVRSGQPLELAIDTSRLHFFDPASGESIGHPLATGATAETVAAG